MKKLIVNPVMCDVFGGRRRGFAKIELRDDGRLSICGVIGPMSNGNCRGGVGQCVDEIRKGDPVDGWTKEMLKKFCDIWDNWHLNDMRPYCEHQKALGWRELARKKVTIYHYTLTRQALDSKNNAEKEAVKALTEGRTFTPTKEQVMFASMPYSVESPEELTGEALQFYEPKKPLYPGYKGAREEKLVGWLYEKDHPEGILCKPCPVCGYKYGSAWLKEEVQEDVIDWLFALPPSKVQPAWC